MVRLVNYRQLPVVAERRHCKRYKVRVVNHQNLECQLTKCSVKVIGGRDRLHLVDLIQPYCVAVVTRGLVFSV